MSTDDITVERSATDLLAERIAASQRVYSRFSLFTKVAFWILLGVVAVAALAPVLTPYTPAEQNYNVVLTSPSIGHPMGTDNLGRDVMTRLFFGARTSLGVSVGVVLLAVSVGIPIGSLAGFSGGWIDETLMRLMDAVLAFPSFILALAVVGMLGPNLVNVIIVIGIVYSPQHARLIRSGVLSVKEELYVEAAQSTGISRPRILIRHVLPNAITPVAVQATFHAAQAMLLEAALSFLGLGVQPPTPTWGVMIASGRQFLPDAWWLTTFPGLIIMITVLSLNVLGDQLRDEFDPHSITEEID